MNNLFKNIFLIMVMGLMSVSCIQKDESSSSSNNNNFTLEGSGGN